VNHANTSISTVLEDLVRHFAPKDRVKLPYTRETHLIDDAGIDSPRMIDLVLAVEDAFQITIADDDLAGVRSFGELIDLVSVRSAEAA